MKRSKWARTVQIFPRYHLDGVDNEQLVEGISALANLRHELSDYEKLKLKYPYIWPTLITDGEDEKLRWAPEAFQLVWLYRDFLRLVWTWPYDPEGLAELTNKRQALEILMGTADLRRILDEEYLSGHMPVGKYQQVWTQIRSKIPHVFPGAMAHIYPSWPSGQFVYAPQIPFQGGLYLLFRESWRARICRNCGAHFVADKQQRQYCSSRCSGQAKKHNDLNWWHRTHGKHAQY